MQVAETAEVPDSVLNTPEVSAELMAMPQENHTEAAFYINNFGGVPFKVHYSEDAGMQSATCLKPDCTDTSIAQSSKLDLRYTPARQTGPSLDSRDLVAHAQKHIMEKL